MAKIEKIPEFSFSWLTTSHDEHPYGDILWHLFWGIVIGASILYSIISKDFLFLIISFIGLFFFFHPIFYEKTDLRISISNQGVIINDSKYSWDEIRGFEILKIGDKFYLYFIPKNIFMLGPIIPLEEFTVNIDEIRKTLGGFLDEYENAVPKWEILYRTFFK